MHSQSAAIDQKHNEDSGQNTPNNQQYCQHRHTAPRLCEGCREAYHYLHSKARAPRAFFPRPRLAHIWHTGLRFSLLKIKEDVRMQLTLSSEQAELIFEIVQAYRTGLEGEASRTSDPRYKEHLQREKELLDPIVIELEQSKSAVEHN
jgi:hypothetical protein